MFTNSICKQGLKGRRGKDTLKFMDDLADSFQNSQYFNRKKTTLKQLMKICHDREITDLIIVNEDRKQPNHWMHVHLPNGPTAYYRLTNCVLAENIWNPGELLPDDYEPELIMNNFTTRLGHTIERMISSMIPHETNLKGRRVMTFHNQRDFVFFRHHRYIFNNEKSASLQEIGPRFTLKLQYLKEGTPDLEFNEYEWIRWKDKGLRVNRLQWAL